ncbi:MAG: nicotinamide riboside transporter PnuC [Bacteroidota bacterium]|nr:nicotinamide riboside transporter PnuC [Candidatus Kapabacteria bacterium]MCS7302244.1 nicotinamide riboside transporter PnuC [Candidatus Kapabacteria bacterium]MDW8074864.1 nicotinamide riboside transporter PnuC [Bacteroidota bacterium]MDW8271503.1 nicotinamide riboside transporter PnuC [Bacteroidota bacterium]
MTIVEWLATALGIAYVLLMIRRNILSWIAGNIGVTLQAVSFYTARLYADMVLQGIYFVLGCYGFWRWWKHPQETKVSPAKRIQKWSLWGKLCGIWLFGSVVWATVLIYWTDAALPEIDATLATASLIATWMQAQRYAENWLLWIGIDTAYALVYWSRALYLYTFLYALFVLMAWRGWLLWNETTNEHSATTC